MKTTIPGQYKQWSLELTPPPRTPLSADVQSQLKQTLAELLIEALGNEFEKPPVGREESDERKANI